MSQLANAQTLTQASNEPVVGDIHKAMSYDTTNAIPRNTGAGQHWDFSSLTAQTGGLTTTTFVAASSVPGASLFAGATLAEDDGAGDYNFYKSSSSPSQFEMLGVYSPGPPSVVFNFTNSATQYSWPMSYGSTFSDSFGGTVSGYISGSSAGNATVTVTGNGTITMPGGVSFGNVLQVTTIRVSTTTITSPISGVETTLSKQYDYFEPTQKFPVMTVAIDINNDPSTGSDTSITVAGNQIITVGINDRNFNSEYAIYPNPAKDNITVKLSNASNNNCAIEIYNLTGQLVRTANLGTASAIENKVSLSGLGSGLYIVKTQLGDKVSSRRLIIE